MLQAPLAERKCLTSHFLSFGYGLSCLEVSPPLRMLNGWGAEEGGHSLNSFPMKHRSILFLHNCNLNQERLVTFPTEQHFVFCVFALLFFGVVFSQWSSSKHAQRKEQENCGNHPDPKNSLSYLWGTAILSAAVNCCDQNCKKWTIWTRLHQESATFNN